MNTINYKTLLLTHFNTMKSHDLFVAMSQTVEASPWHREANVLVHTEMVVEEYVKLTDAANNNQDWSYHDYLGGLCCVWHDTGKPPARTPKHSEERGDYFAYHGHELLSARLFENYAVSTSMFSDPADLFAVEWMIHHHMPWSIKDTEKLASLIATMKYFGGQSMYDAYTRALLADQYGRIADDQAGKNASALAWVENLNITPDIVTPRLSRPVNGEFAEKVLFIPIGPSGAGKSTLFKNYISTLALEVETYSLDALRHQYYHPTDYTIAYEKSVADSSFESRAKQEFLRLVKTGAHLYIDNTNLSAKRRAFYISEARRRGYTPYAFHLLSNLDVLIARQRTRGDKNVPVGAVKQQYMALTVPSIGEFDAIYVV